MYDLAKRMATVGKGHTMCMLPGSCDGELYVNLGRGTPHTQGPASTLRVTCHTTPLSRPRARPDSNQYA